MAKKKRRIRINRRLQAEREVVEKAEAAKKAAEAKKAGVLPKPISERGKFFKSDSTGTKE